MTPSPELSAAIEYRPAILETGPTYGGCEGTCLCGRPAQRALEATHELVCEVCCGHECEMCGADLLVTETAPRCARCRENVASLASMAPLMEAIEASVTMTHPTSRLPLCDLCDEPDPSVHGGGDVGGVAVPAMCGACRCRHHMIKGQHDEDCREGGACLGCVGENEGYSVPHDCGGAPTQDSAGWWHHG